MEWDTSSDRVVEKKYNVIIRRIAFIYQQGQSCPLKMKEIGKELFSNSGHALQSRGFYWMEKVNFAF